MVFISKKQINEIETKIEELNETLYKIKDLVTELRTEVTREIKVKVKESDLTVYNLSSGVEVQCSKVIQQLPEEMTRDAKKRMDTYREMQESRIHDMKEARKIERERLWKLLEEAKKNCGL